LARAPSYAGHLIGFLPGAYAALWQPVVLYEHQRAD
jgi:hypothetical protein